ncbi:MAG: TenA family protein [Paramuribaculum sp.]|nr:TenA family protein [Paramuribaculum sp.]
MSQRKWSEEAWEQADHIYRAILELPFVRELAAGTLDREIFNRYIGQDSLYINRYCKVLGHIASRLDDADMTEAFLGFAQDGVAVEKNLHATYISGQPTVMSPACLFYTSLLKAQATGPVEVEAAAILPCFWVYLKVGRHIAATMQPGNPYHEWIECYSDAAFDRSNDKAIAICDTLAENASPEVRAAMTRIFVECTRMEWLFWQGAYEDLDWPEIIC